MRRTVREGESYKCPVTNVIFEKRVEDLCGYDVYHAHVCVSKKKAYMCPAWIVNKKGEKTQFILVRILRTRCFSPELWFGVFDVTSEACEIIRANLTTYFDKNDWATDTEIPLPEVDIAR